MHAARYFDDLRTNHRAIYLASISLLALTVMMVVAMTVDHRQIAGFSVWIKPVKFSLSIAIFLVTLPYYITALNISDIRKVRIERRILWLLIFEFLLIFIQASRGIGSHFNVSTFLNARIYNLMGLTIMLVTILMFVVLVLYLRPSTRPDMPKPELYAHQVALALFLFGCAIGGRMVGNFSHDVGVATESTYMPFTGWNLYIGDLRISHFIALHSLQLVPLACAFLSRTSAFLISLAMLVISLFFFFNAIAGNGLVG